MKKKEVRSSRDVNNQPAAVFVVFNPIRERQRDIFFLRFGYREAITLTERKKREFSYGIDLFTKKKKREKSIFTST